MGLSSSLSLEVPGGGERDLKRGGGGWGDVSLRKVASFVYYNRKRRPGSTTFSSRKWALFSPLNSVRTGKC